jgi:hypothetical protein
MEKPWNKGRFFVLSMYIQETMLCKRVLISNLQRDFRWFVNIAHERNAKVPAMAC